MNMIKITEKDDKAWVTFSVEPMDVESMEIVGEWNNWEPEPMKVKKSGEFYITRILERGKSYQFGYRCGDTWFCDNGLKTVSTPFGSSNSLLEL